MTWVNEEGLAMTWEKGGILDSRLRGNGLSLWGGWGRGRMQCAPTFSCHCEESASGGRRSNLRVLVGTKGCGEIATAFLRRASQ